MQPDWSSIPWKGFPHDVSEENSLAWCKENVQWTANANALQTLDLWLPAEPNHMRDNKPPPPEYLPTRKGPWIIYVHGGAWRDPAITPSSFVPTVKHLLSNSDAKDHIAGLASISYSLSPHPNHATNPSPPKDPTQPSDPSRNAKHPDHILDVLTALEYLQQKAGFGDNYILVGHSCGATLAFQAAMNPSRWSETSISPTPKKPKIVVGLNGLYDLPGLIEHPDPKHEQLVEVYEAFTRLAFGDNKEDWRSVSPKFVENWGKEWSNGVKVVLAQSMEDSLVPYNQIESMFASLKQSCTESLKISEAKIVGDHNEVWEKGDRLAEIVLELVKGL